MSQPASPRRSGGRLLLFIALGALVPIGVVMLALGPKGFTDFRARQKSAEAKLNVRQLCRLALRHHEQQKVWLEAGPLPNPVPTGDAVPFPEDAKFAALGFKPGKVRYQYEVKLEPEVIRCTARGDLNADGVLSNFTIAILPDSREITAIDIDNELE